MNTRIQAAKAALEAAELACPHHESGGIAGHACCRDLVVATDELLAAVAGTTSAPHRLRTAALTAMALALSACVTAHAGDWSKLTIAEEAAFQATHAIDWSQTLDIARRRTPIYTYCWPSCGVRIAGYSHPYCEAESAWIIGREPSAARVNEYMAETAVAHVAISYLFLKHPRLEQVWQLTTLGIAVGTVSHNFSIGLRARF